MLTPRKFSVAIVQVSPVFYNLEASMQKLEQCLSEAAAGGARLIVFGETWLPGYPAWLDYCRDAALWSHAPVKELYALLRQNSPVIDGKEIAHIRRLAGEFNVTVVLGFNERVEAGPGNGTLYNSLLIINDKGEIANHHRKLVPTYTERMVWGQGDASGLQAVRTSGVRVGGLICWEHWMPLSRQAMHVSGEDIHVAVWPNVHDMHQVASRQYAFEGRCFVIAAGMMMKTDDLPEELEIRGMPHGWILRGGSCVIAPDGRFILEPVFDREEIIHCTFDLSETDKEKMTLDVTGHYHRDDIFKLQVNRNRA